MSRVTGGENAAPEDVFVKTKTAELHYLEWGGSNRERTLLLLHGIGDNAHIWDVFAREASRSFHVIALDQRGHGSSETPVPPAYTCEDYVADLAGFIELLHLDKVILLGHSMGALHGTAYAAQNPETVSALVHVDIEPYPPGWNKKYLLNLYRDLPAHYHSVEEYVDGKMQNSPFADRQFLMNFAVHALREEDGKYCDTYDREVLRHFDAYDLKPVLKDVVCPALVVRGEESAVMDRQAAEEMSSAMPRGVFTEIKNAAHPVPADNPGAFAEAVLHFLGVI